MNELYCIECEEMLFTVPIFNDGSPDFPPSFLFCGNPECKRHGLLTVTYKSKDPKIITKKKKVILRNKIKKTKRKSAKSEHQTI
jgi:hypothetical protein